MKTSMLAAVLVLALGQGYAQDASDEVPEREWRPKAERRILERLNSSGVRTLKCDFVVNSVGAAPSLEVAVPGKTTVVNFWRPSCEPCKPLLEELAIFSKKAAGDTVVLAAAEGGSPYGKPVDLAKVREQIGGIVRKHGVSFPVCGYTDHAQTKLWQAEGVPLTVFFTPSGQVGRVAIGAVEASSVLKQLQHGWRP